MYYRVAEMLNEDDRVEIRQLVEEILTAKGATMLLVDEDLRAQIEALAAGLVAVGNDVKTLDQRAQQMSAKLDGQDAKLDEILRRLP